MPDDARDGCPVATVGATMEDMTVRKKNSSQARHAEKPGIEKLAIVVVTYKRQELLSTATRRAAWSRGSPPMSNASGAIRCPT